MKTVSTDEFYELMCSIYFYRVDYHNGRCKGIDYYTEIPPEEDEEFMLSKVKLIASLLGDK